MKKKGSRGKNPAVSCLLIVPIRMSRAKIHHSSGSTWFQPPASYHYPILTIPFPQMSPSPCSIEPFLQASSFCNLNLYLPFPQLQTWYLLPIVIYVSVPFLSFLFSSIKLTYSYYYTIKTSSCTLPPV